MGVNVDNIPDWVDGAEYPSKVAGWYKMKLKEFDVQAKGTRVWIRADFTSADGVKASLSQNIFTSPQTDGEKIANKITFGLFGQLWAAAGLSEADYPAPNPRAISHALNSYEGNLEVDASCDTNDRGYVEIKRFRKAS